MIDQLYDLVYTFFKRIVKAVSPTVLKKKMCYCGAVNTTNEINTLDVHMITGQNNNRLQIIIKCGNQTVKNIFFTPVRATYGRYALFRKAIIFYGLSSFSGIF